ncbi:hypothetical protein DFH08DRAFT_963159 [Mycena albidolilacea]|uniref:Zn(2)-C6 fungal-type domain-containing protein n=1 Tax=Mycena albidolilacea TaxID=1033008 RepID=A0AAD6ZVE3_9AGAR|nr:hypothetical protein DFH08DRAFT_963159 [Mycena albidolilacea]
MPQLANKSEAEYLDRLCAMSANNTENLEIDDGEDRKEAERKAAKDWKVEEKRKKKEKEAAAKLASQALGSGGKTKGKAKATRKASDIDEDEEDETPAEKKAKRDPCQRCTKLNIPCADPDPSESRSRACEACCKSKVRCVRESPDSDGRNVYGAVQELTDLVDGNFEDVYNSQHKIKGTLHDILQCEIIQLQLDFGHHGETEATRILDAWKKRRVDWAAADKAQQDKGEGSSKKKD